MKPSMRSCYCVKLKRLARVSVAQTDLHGEAIPLCTDQTRNSFPEGTRDDPEARSDPNHSKKSIAQ